MMADGSNSCAPASSSQNAGLDVHSTTKKCSGCNLPTKDHPGPVGKSKCLVGMLKALTERVSDLEKTATEREEDFAREKSLAEQRQETFLSVIASLEERVETLETRLEAVDPSLSAEKRRTVTPSADQEELPEARSGNKNADVKGDSHSLCSFATESLIDVAPCTTGCKSTTPQLSLEEKKSADLVAEDAGVEPLDRPQAFDTDSKNVGVTASIKLQTYADATQEHGPLPTTFGETELVQGEVPHSGGWIPARTRRLRSNSSQTKGLVGAHRVKCTPCHLRGLSLDSTVQDVLAYCKKKNVVATGCYLVRSRVWGTLSAKVFVSSNDLDKVLEVSFWPDLIKCRKWETHLPNRQQS